MFLGLSQISASCSYKIVLIKKACSEIANFLHLFIGAHELSKDDNPNNYIKVVKIIVHETYDRDNLPGYKRFNNDIALLQLERPIMFGARAQPVCLPRQGDAPQVGSKCYITGM